MPYSTRGKVFTSSPLQLRRKHARTLLAGALLFVVAGCKGDQATITPATEAGVVLLDQGPQWDDGQRAAFYSQTQGSALVPWAWAKVLKLDDGTAFTDALTVRYGYLPNAASANHLPVGFTLTSDGQSLGMSCAACHTRQIEADGKQYRVDGGPAISDFEKLLRDLVGSVGKVLESDANFTTFGDAVLGATAGVEPRKKLREAVTQWHNRESAMIKGALTSQGIWGLGRLDAISMIFNRVAGLDIGTGPDRIIASNIKPADAPTRYPFIWNAPKQDKIQWPGFADNGDNLLGLARNLGEVYGVFAIFHPTKDPLDLMGVNLHSDNSADFPGLAKLENAIQKIGAPKFPGVPDPALVGRGQGIFVAQCASCHGQELKNGKLVEKPGASRPGHLEMTWETQRVDVGTDSREFSLFLRTADTGILAGSRPLFRTIPQNDCTFNVLKSAVAGSIIQRAFHPPFLPPELFNLHQKPRLSTPQEINQALQGAFNATDFCKPQTPRYESRVMHGIWAVAPYLHNGSVPTLDALLHPCKDRPVTFAVGRAYDFKKVGLAEAQPGSTYSRTTTDATDRNSGNSRCGHEGAGFGTELNENDRLALIEFLKVL